MITQTEEKKHERKNRFNGESVELTAEEAEKHDLIFKYELQATIEDRVFGADGHSKYWAKMRKLLTWFQKNNAKAYMVLLD